MTYSLFDLSSKTAIVTGAAKGNGFAIAKGFLNAGAEVYFVDIIEKELLNAVNLLRNSKSFMVVADITKEKNIEEITSKVINDSGKIDILVNNTGITYGGISAENYPYDLWIKTFEVNLSSVFKLCQSIGRRMIERKSGVIINVTSLGSELGFPDNPSYVAAKGGVKMLTKALARDWAKYNIRVNNLCPGYIKTDMTIKSYNDKILYDERINRMMIKRWGEPEDLVGPAIFLASDASRYITGIDLSVDGGWLANGL